MSPGRTFWKWSGRVDLNHRPPGPEPVCQKSLSHRPGVTYGIQGNKKSPSHSQPFATGNHRSGRKGRRAWLKRRNAFANSSTGRTARLWFTIMEVLVYHTALNTPVN